jgi:hypothetical protein
MKKIIFILFFMMLLWSSKSFAVVTYYEVGSGTNWSSTSSWAITSGGASGVGPPTASDTVIFDSNSGNCTVDVTTAVAASLSMTAGTGNYANTLTFTNAKKLTVSGNVTWSSTTVLSGTGTLAFGAAATWTTAGKTFPGSVILFNGIQTLGDAHTITGTVSVSSNGNTSTQIAGSINMTMGSLNAVQIILHSTQTYTITSSWTAIPTPGSFYPTYYTASTASSSAFINYTGLNSSLELVGLEFTDINASGSSAAVYNYFGGTLTRSSNISNVTAASFGGGGGNGGFFLQ